MMTYGALAERQRFVGNLCGLDLVLHLIPHLVHILDYAIGVYNVQEPWLFAHERLEAYQCSLSFLELAESSVMKVNTYIQLSLRTGAMPVEPAQRGLALVDRVALLVRGLTGKT
jgi:hypothetical protein